MAEEIGFENGRNSNFQGLVTLTLTLDPAIRHTVVHHSSTSTYTPNFIEIEETFCGRTDGRTDVRTDVRTDIFPPSNIIRSTFGSRPKQVLLANCVTTGLFHLHACPVKFWRECCHVEYMHTFRVPVYCTVVSMVFVNLDPPLLIFSSV